MTTEERHRHDFQEGVCTRCGLERDPARGGRPRGGTNEVNELGLTEREQQILDLSATMNQRQIGLELGISRQAVNQVVARLREKGLMPEK